LSYSDILAHFAPDFDIFGEASLLVDDFEPGTGSLINTDQSSVFAESTLLCRGWSLPADKVLTS
jgi:hypothetical protein